MTLQDKEFVLGITGGIACYKVPDIIRGIREAGGNVSVIMTQSATEFVKPLVFQAISERPVATSLFDLEQESKIGHIKISEDADGFIIAPATANIIGKTALGIGDDLLSTALLANQAPLFIAPAMNNRMWENPAVQKNLETLRQRGAEIIDPESGYLACGSYGPGRMAAPATIVRHIQDWFTAGKNVDLSRQPLTGIKVVITAGPTREKIDAVRYISNYSSGKMGYAIAARCRDLGASVDLISGPTALKPPSGINTVYVESTQEMYDVVMEKAESARLVIKSAAVSDFSVERPSDQKIKKTESMSLQLRKTPDILLELGQRKKDTQFLVGFAAESQQIETYAQAKMASKNLDLVVANDITQSDAGFDVDTNRVLIIDQKTTQSLPLMSKDEVAARIVDAVIHSERWNQIKTLP